MKAVNMSFHHILYMLVILVKFQNEIYDRRIFLFYLVIRYKPIESMLAVRCMLFRLYKSEKIFTIVKNIH